MSAGADCLRTILDNIGGLYDDDVAIVVLEDGGMGGGCIDDAVVFVGREYFL